MKNDDFFANYKVSYPFHITRFRALHEHQFDGAFTFAGESHNFWEFSCILDGDMESVHDGKIYTVTPGDFICVPPMVFHSSRTLGKPSRNLNFCFEHTGILPANFTEGVFHLSPLEIDELTNIIHKLQEAFQGDCPDPDLGAEATHSLASFLIRLSKHHKSHARLTNSRSSLMYQKLVETMRMLMYENLTIPQIASRNAISVTTTKELFQKYAGVSPKAYYAEIRGNEALRLLKEGKEIIEIAEVLNYSSPNYFSYSFKKQFGLPPGQYRKQLWEENT